MERTATEEKQIMAQKTMGMYCLFCPCLCLMFCLINVMSVVLLPLTAKPEVTWSTESSWSSTSCSVVAAGISNRGACDPDTTTMSLRNSLYGRVEQFSECPGWKYCAAEDTQCQCSGDVLFATGRFISHFVPDMKRTVLHKNVPGAVHCSTKAFGRDPAPGSVKYCWCMPSAVAEVVREKGPLNSTSCLAVADKAYSRSSKSTEGRSLLSVRTARRAMYETAHQDRSHLEHAEIRTANIQRGSLELLALDDSSGGKSCSDVYLPWAMVELKDMEGHSRLRCAYEYGAEAVSRENSAARANELYRRYRSATGSDINCFMRRDSCIVATETPANLPKDELQRSDSQTKHAIAEFIAAFVILCLIGLAWSPEDKTEWNEKYVLIVFYVALVLFMFMLALLYGAADDPKGSGSLAVGVIFIFAIVSFILMVGVPLGAKYGLRRYRSSGSEPLLSVD